MALKLDMSKIYDRVEWVCLDRIMEKLGFHPRWRNLMMQCVSTMTYSIRINGKPTDHISIRINGKPTDHISPTRGLKQGDPLSPYLFLLCGEGLSTLIKKAVNEGSMEGISICRNGPCLSHLFFADGSLIFCKATIGECDALQRILKVYKEASGQQLNRAKTSLYFSSNTAREDQKEIKARFGAQVIK